MDIDKEAVLEKLKQQMEELNQIWQGERERLEKLARKAHANLSANPEGAGFITNLDELLGYLERVDPRPPVLYWQT